MNDPHYKTCEKSKGIWKPDRSHFCSISRKLIPRMDHYCPFVLCTIGYSNHGIFFLLCLYHTVGISLGLLGFFKWMYEDFFAFVKQTTPLKGLLFSGFLLVDASIVISLLTFTSYMLFFNIKFVSENRTTIDWYEDREKATIMRSGGQAYGRVRSNQC